MGFPTSDQARAFSRHLIMFGVRQALVKARPDLKDQIKLDDRTGHVQVTLPDDRLQRSVVLGIVRSRHLMHLHVFGLLPDASQVQVALPVDAPAETVAEAAFAVFDACQAGTPLDSPWRWNQPDDSTAVRLADRLTRHDVNVKKVAGTNRILPDAYGDYEDCGTAPTQVVEAVAISTEWGRLAVWRDERAGWVIDASEANRRRRLDIGLLLTGRVSQTPWIAPDQVSEDQLVEAVLIALKQGPEGWPDVDYRLSCRGNPDALACAAALALRGAGFFRTEHPHWTGDAAVRSSHRVEISQRRITLSSIKSIYADAALAGAADSLIVFATDGATRDAAAWAERAHIPVFGLNVREENPRVFEDSGVGVWAVNGTADAYLPVVF